MRTVLKVVAFLALAPIALLLLFVLAIAAVVGLPILWEQAVARLTSPPDRGSSPS